MRNRRGTAALVLCMILSAAFASSAQANWKIGETEAAGNESFAVSNSSNFTLETTILGTPLKVTATGLACSGTCQLIGGTRKATGALKFTGVTVDSPANCTVSGGTFTTPALQTEAIMDPSGGTATFIKIAPASGTTLIQFMIDGPTCAIDGLTVTAKGTVTCRFDDTNTATVKQPLTCSAAEQTTGGGSLTINSQAAVLTGSATMALSGANAGQAFGVN